MITAHVTEAQWQRQVRDLLALTGFQLVYATWNSRHSPAGFPDLLAIRDDHPGYTLAVLELKSARGRIRPVQSTWLSAWSGIAATVNPLCQHVYVITGVFKPEDFDRLAAILQELPS